MAHIKKIHHSQGISLTHFTFSKIQGMVAIGITLGGVVIALANVWLLASLAPLREVNIKQDGQIYAIDQREDDHFKILQSSLSRLEEKIDKMLQRNISMK